jgi:predicted RNA-binding Zn-ribbon protein involved in translation (DUF1610 family)
MTGTDAKSGRQRVETGGLCPDCGSEIVRVEVSRLPHVAFKKQMFDACFFDRQSLEQPWRGNTVITYHEEIEIERTEAVA